MDINKRQGLPVPLKSKYRKLTPYRTTNRLPETFCFILKTLKLVKLLDP